MYIRAYHNSRKINCPMNHRNCDFSRVLKKIHTRSIALSLNCSGLKDFCKKSENFLDLILATVYNLNV